MENLNTAEFEERVFDDGEKCLVLFSRKDCHVCKEVHPMLEELEEDYEDSEFGFYHIYVDDEKDLFQRFALKGVPQVLFFADGELVGKIAGKQDEDEYTDKIDEIIG